METTGIMGDLQGQFRDYMGVLVKVSPFGDCSGENAILQDALKNSKHVGNNHGTYTRCKVFSVSGELFST